MKFIKKITAILLISLLSVGNVIAAGIPDEPMVIYGNVSGNNQDTLKIYDWNNNLLEEITIKSWWKYWTDKTFSSDKIKLNKFDWELKFKIWDKTANISKWEINICDTSAIYQKWGICEYNLSFSNTDNSLDDLDKFFENITADNVVIEEKYKTDNINDIFDWKIFEKETSIVKNTIWENILKSIYDNKKVIVTSNKLEVAKKINKKIILINNSKKEALFIDENTEINELNVVIEKPTKLTNISTIKSKINKKIIWAVEIPTNKQITFKKFIRVCTQLIANKTKDLKVYYSHNNVNWTLDTNAKNIEIWNGQVCFDVNHLTSFVVWEDETIVAPRRSSGWSSSNTYAVTNSNNVNVVTNTSKPKNETKNTIINSTEETTIKNTDKNKISNKIKKLDLSKYNWKIYIHSKLKIKSNIYIKNLRDFNKNIKIEENVLWFKLLKLKWDLEYNKKVDYYKKRIIREIRLNWIRESMFKHLNKMTITYWISKYNKTDWEIKQFYKELSYENINNFLFKIVRLKQKDDMINKTLEKRRLTELKIK